MALNHASPGQALDVRPFGARLLTEKTAALFKSRDFELMRLVLLAGKSFPPHKVAGDITIHCLEGTLAVGLTVELANTTVTLAAGELLFLEGNALHGVTALSDASALVTIALKPGSARP